MKRLTTRTVLERIGYKSRETLRGLIRAGKFPPPMRDAGSSVNFWTEDDVDRYVQKGIDERELVAVAAARTPVDSGQALPLQPHSRANDVGTS